MAKARNAIRGHLTSFRMILLSFILMILAGAVMLCLPFASKGDEPVSFLNALFTSTSAACVTGLVVFDTATKWTMFGRVVILILIQVAIFRLPGHFHFGFSRITAVRPRCAEHTKQRQEKQHTCCSHNDGQCTFRLFRRHGYTP